MISDDLRKQNITFITISQGWDGLPIAYHLQEEGNESILAQVQNKKELKMDDDEDPDDKKERLSQYDNMLDKHPARKVVDALKKVKNKDDYFIFCDQNSLWPYAEELLDAGFTKGLFPTQEDYDFEKGREAAMDFVKEHYPGIKIISHEKYSTVEEAKKAVEESEVPLVIQSEGDFVSTICPEDDVEKNHIAILAALDKHAKDYAKGEIILKEKLVQPIEITPQIVFWDGNAVFTDLDIETKNIGNGENNGNQVGCGTNLIIRTDMDDKINEIAFPPIVYEMASKRKGIFVWDISLYFTDDGIYFGEFCSNRFGYDALMTEMTMAHGPGMYFAKLMAGENPLEDFKFGTAARIFNLNRAKDQEISVENDKPIWLYEVKKKDDKMLSVGDCWDLGVVTGRGNDISEAVDNLYDNVTFLTFKEKYFRTKSDFVENYPTSIIHRFEGTNHEWYEAPDYEPSEDDGLTSEDRHVIRMAEEIKKHDTIEEMKESITKRLSKIIYE